MSSKSEKSEPVGERVRIYLRGTQYWATLQHRRRQLRRSLGTNNVKTARRQALAWDQEIQAGTHLITSPREPTTIAQAVEMLLAVCEAEGRALKTLTRYRGVLQRVVNLAAEKGQHDLQDLDLAWIDRYRQLRRKAGAAPKTLFTEVMIVRQLTKFAKSRRLIAQDPLDGLKNPEPKGTPQPFWTHEEAQQILAATQEPQRSVFTMLNETGLRIGELQWLTWDDVDFEQNLLYIRPKPGWTTKTGNQRTVPLTPIARTVLENQSQRHRWVFTAAPSRKYPLGDHQISERRLLTSLKRTLKKLGLPGHLHTFRHSYISRAILNGTPEAIVRAWVGHVDDATLKLYTHIASQQSPQAMRQLHDRIWERDPSHSSPE